MSTFHYIKNFLLGLFVSLLFFTAASIFSQQSLAWGRTLGWGCNTYTYHTSTMPNMKVSLCLNEHSSNGNWYIQTDAYLTNYYGNACSGIITLWDISGINGWENDGRVKVICPQTVGQQVHFSGVSEQLYYNLFTNVGDTFLGTIDMYDLYGNYQNPTVQSPSGKSQ